MEIKVGGFYETRGGQVVGPIERTPPATGTPPDVWVWRAKVEGEWWHWKENGRWYQAPGQEAANDLIAQASPLLAASKHARNELDATFTAQAMPLSEAQSAAFKKIVEQAGTPSNTHSHESSAPMTKHRLLDLAKEATADRGLNYGKPEDNFARIARRWNTFLVNRGYISPHQRLTDFGGPINPADVAMMCADLKMARLENQPVHQDSWVDLAGYAACGAEIALARTPQNKPAADGWLHRMISSPIMPPQFDGTERIQYKTADGKDSNIADAIVVPWEKVTQFRKI